MDINTVKLVLKVLDMLSMGLERRGEIKSKADELATDLRAMLAEDRDPTQEEWDELFARLGAAESTIDTRADEARALLAQQANDEGSGDD